MYVVDAATRRWYYEYYMRREVTEPDPAYFNGLQVTPGSTPFVKTLLGVDPVVDWSQENKLVLQIPAIKREALMKPSAVKALSFQFVVSGGHVTPTEVVDSRFRYHAERFCDKSQLVEIEL